MCVCLKDKRLQVLLNVQSFNAPSVLTVSYSVVVMMRCKAVDNSQIFKICYLMNNYQSRIHLHLEYANNVRDPYLRKDNERLEGVQFEVWS